MRRGSINPVSGKGRLRLRPFVTTIIFFLSLVLFFSLFVWSYFSADRGGYLGSAASRGEKLIIWAGLLFSVPLCAPSAALWRFIAGKLHIIITAAATVTLLMVLVSGTFKKGSFADVEYGSAHWARGKELAIFRQNAPNDIPLADGVYLTRKCRSANNNVFLLAAPGGGKTFNVIIPAIEAHTRPGARQGSFFCTDTKGALYRDTVKLLRERGYKVLLLNLADPWLSNRYNPLENVHAERKYTEISTIASSIAHNSRDEDAAVGENVWEATFKALMSAILMYQFDFAVNPVTGESENRSMRRTAELILSVKVERTKSGYEVTGEAADIIRAIKKNDPRHPSVTNFEFVTTGAIETVSSVIFTAGSKISTFLYPETDCLMQSNEIRLDDIFYKPHAVFLNYSISSPYSVIAAMFIEQLLNAAYYNAEVVNAKTGALARPFKLFLDELPNICRVHALSKVTSTCRSYNIDIILSVQSMQQLRRMFKDEEKTIMNNCATHIYLGSGESDALKEISEALGKTTTNDLSFSRSTGIAKNGSGGSDSERSMGRELALPSEIYSMPNRYAIVKMQNKPPVFAEKFKTTRQPWYSELGGKGCPENSRPIHVDLEALMLRHRAEYEAERLAAAEHARQRAKDEEDEAL